MLVQVCSLETELQSGRLLNPSCQVSCQREGALLLPPRFPNDLLLVETGGRKIEEEEAEINTFCTLWSTLEPSNLFWQWSLHTQFLLLEIQMQIDLWCAICVSSRWKAILGTYGLCIQGSGQPKRSHLPALVPYPYCGEEYFLCFLLFLNEELHLLAGLLYPTSLLFHTTTLEYPWCAINIPPRELGVSQKLPVTAIKIRTDLNQNRNPFLRMCGQSISADTAKSGGTWCSPAVTCSAAKASSSQKKHF